MDWVDIAIQVLALLRRIRKNPHLKGKQLRTLVLVPLNPSVSLEGVQEALDTAMPPDARVLVFPGFTVTP